MNLTNLDLKCYHQAFNPRIHKVDEASIVVLNHHNNVQRVLCDFPEVLWDIIDGFDKDFAIIFEEENAMFQFIFINEIDKTPVQLQKKDWLITDTMSNDSSELVNLPPHWKQIPIVKLDNHSGIEIIRK